MVRKLFSSVLLVMVLALLVAPVSAQDDTPPTRIRVAHFAVDTPTADVYVDGELALAELSYTVVSGYTDLEPGSYHIAVAPTGAGEAGAVIEADVTLAEGHSYTIAAIGQLADESLQGLVIDETQAFIDAGLPEAVTPVLLVNAISNSPSVDIFAGGQPFLLDIPFGEYRAIEFPLDIIPITITVAGDPESIVLEEDFFGVPNTLSLATIMGSYPDNFTRVLVNTSDLTAAEFLAGTSASPIISFNSLVGAIGTLVQSGVALPETEPNSTFFAPIDAAFVEEAPMMNIVSNDPETLAQLLLYHGVQGPLTLSQMLTGIERGGGEFEVETAQGSTITLSVEDGQLLINGRVRVIYPNIIVSDGIIHIIDDILLPPRD